jgi:outer membrane cobalamin receptor
VSTHSISLELMRRAGRSVVGFLALGYPCWAQTPTKAGHTHEDLTQVSIESLMNMEVTSVSKREQKLWQTAAAILVITQEDILRSGATNLPDLLRMLPGMDAAQINSNT